MNERERSFLAAQRVARLATIGSDGTSSLVPVCFALIGDDKLSIVSVLDDKPKSVADRELARVRNVRRDPRVSVLADHYDEDWSQLGFVQVKGEARVIGPDDPDYSGAITALREKYPQYRDMAVEERLVMVIEPDRTTSWGV